MTNTTPRVSIAIPVFNGAKYLPAALDCLLAQSYTDFEIIISDNASTDETQAICERYAAGDARVRYHRVEQNQGLIWNFNRVVALARGEYFTWAAHDDIRSIDYLQQCVAVLERDTDVILVHTQSTCIDAAGEVIPAESRTAFTTCAGHDMTPAQNTRRTARLLSRWPHRRLEGVLMYTTMCDEFYGLIRTNVLKQTGLLRPFFGSDMVLLAELSLLGRIHVLPTVAFFSRSHAEQATFSQGEPENQLAPIKQPRFNWAIPRKIRYPMSLLGLLLTTRLRFIERLKCSGVVIKFGLQPRKWRGVWTDLQALWQHRSTKRGSKPSPA